MVSSCQNMQLEKACVYLPTWQVDKLTKNRAVELQGGKNMENKLSEKQLIILSIMIEQYARKVSETAIYHPEKLPDLSIQIQEMARMIRREYDILSFEDMLEIVKNYKSWE